MLFVLSPLGRIFGLHLGLVFQTLKMSCYLYENHRGSPTLILLNVLGVLGVLNVLNVLNVFHVLHVLHVLNVLHGRIIGLLGLVFHIL